MRPNFHHLFFDLDNTLLDFDYASLYSFNELLSSRGYETKEAYYQIYKSYNQKMWEAFEAKEIDAVSLRSKRFQLFLEHMNWDENPKEWGESYLEGLIPPTKYISKAEEIIFHLKDHFHIHIITNGLKEVQRPRINKAGLDSYISSITVSDEINYAKPAPAFFQYAIDQAGINDKDKILVIGDSYSSDVKGAFDSGLKSCWFNPNQKKTNDDLHDYEIQSLSELIKILQ